MTTVRFLLESHLDTAAGYIRRFPKER